jgi:acyl dehydratase
MRLIMPRVINGIDDLKALIGQEAGSSEWHTITQQQIDAFADITSDHQWIHTDPERARRESPYGATIAHGFLTVSLLSGMIEEAISLQGDLKMRINYGFNRLRFTSAVPAGARVRARFTVNGLKEIQGGVEIAWGVIVEIEGQTKPALVAEWLDRSYLS